MRSLSDTLKNAQQATSIDALIKIVLTHGEDSYTYTKTRILDINHPEEPYSQRCDLVLHNRDGALTALDLQGFKGVISYGAVGKAGEEYSATAPLWVIPQTLKSSPGKMDCTLSLIGIPNHMAMDKASVLYKPDSDDTKSVKTLINQVLGATLTCFNHCTAYEVVWEVGYDTLADTYKPRDGLRIYVGASRLSVFRKLMDYTGNVARVKADGKWHISQPVISGEVYDSLYGLESGHPFFSKAYSKRLVVPNYIVVQSQPDDDPQYSGYAKDQVSIDALKDDASGESGERRDYHQMRLESDEQAGDIAAAILSQHQLWTEMGAASVPFWNVGAEVFDYVKVGAFNANDVYRVGNIGQLRRHWNAEKAQAPMTFSFGNWMTVRKALAGLDPTGSITTDDLEAYFARLMVKDLYAENILAENVNFAWIDPDNNVDLSKIGDNLDSLPDGEVYARVKTLHLDAGQIKLDENVLYKAGYNPSLKMPSDADLDDIPDGAIYQRVKSAALTAGGLVIVDNLYVDWDEGTYGLLRQTDISAGHIKLTSQAVFDDQWYNESGVEIDARHGINIYGKDNALTTRATKTGTIQCYVGSDGKIYAGGGAVRIGTGGIDIYGKELVLRDSEGTRRGWLHGASGVLYLEAYGDTDIYIDAQGNYITLEGDYISMKGQLVPWSHEDYWNGEPDLAWYMIYGKWIYSSDGAIHEYQGHDDIGLLKAIKGKLKDGRRIIDANTLPQDLVVTNKKNQKYVNIAGLAGFNIGVQKTLLAEIENLKAEVALLKGV